MKIIYLLLIFFSVSLFPILAQETTKSLFKKECRITGGGGISSGFDGASVGGSFWVQMDYRLSKNFSIATEFENTNYNRPSFYLPFGPIAAGYDKQQIVDNYASILIKYHFPELSKFSFAVSSGWTYYIHASDFFDYDISSNGTQYYSRQLASDDLSIPVLLEAFYPISKAFQVGLRGKYNLIANNLTTYSVGAGLSIKL